MAKYKDIEPKKQSILRDLMLFIKRERKTSEQRIAEQKWRKENLDKWGIGPWEGRALWLFYLPLMLIIGPLYVLYNIIHVFKKKAEPKERHIGYGSGHHGHYG